jgi:hypothetical protein
MDQAGAANLPELGFEPSAEMDGVKAKETVDQKIKIRVTQRAYERPLTKLVPFQRYLLLLNLKVG